MQIVDAQIHLWGTGLPSNQAHWQVTSFTTAEAVALMDEAGVDAAVIHPPGWDPGSTKMAFRAVRDFPGRFAIRGVKDAAVGNVLDGVPVRKRIPGPLVENGRGRHQQDPVLRCGCAARDDQNTDQDRQPEAVSCCLKEVFFDHEDRNRCVISG